MNSAVVYYSRTGHTRLIAECVADALCGSLITLEPAGLDFRSTFSAYCIGGMYAALGVGSGYICTLPIPSSVDLLVLGSPVWAANLTPVVRSFTRDDHGRRAFAFFCTCAESPGKTFDSVHEIIHEKSVLLNKKAFRFAPEYSETELLASAREWAATLKEYVQRKEQ